MVLAGACIAAFALVPSGTTSLMTPVSFNQTWHLAGTELDFSKSLSVNCPMNIQLGCDFQGYCHGNDQLVNLLESGRSSVSRTFKIVHKL